jgi:hypothetical protein
MGAYPILRLFAALRDGTRIAVRWSLYKRKALSLSALV